VEQIYQQVIADLTEAESLLPDENDVYATKGAAAAILSRVYLGMGDYANARDAADRVIQSGEFELTGTYAEAFNNNPNSTEDIFAMQVSEQDGTNDMQLYCSIPDFGGRDGDVQIEQKHLDLYEAGDARLGMFYEGNGALRTGKWKLQYKNVTVVRLAEMYLTRAECNFRLGTVVGDTPENDLNLIRDRVGLDPIVGPDLGAILNERKLELALEGSTIHDLKRLHGSADGFAYNANAMVFPVPAREISANKNLEQNPGYGEN
jgi:tetratricopeptide (TPR) repeat protein